MKIRDLKIKLIASTLLFIPMSCMYLGDDHHSGGHYSWLHLERNQPSIHGQVAPHITEESPVTIHRKSQMEIEAPNQMGQGT